MKKIDAIDHMQYSNRAIHRRIDCWIDRLNAVHFPLCNLRASQLIPQGLTKVWARVFRKSYLILLAAFISPSFAATQEDGNMPSMSKAEKMYLDFGIGIGSAKGWTGSSLAMNAMSMGVYFNKKIGAEVGMGALANGTYHDHEVRTVDIHIAAKGLLPLSDQFLIYAKPGFGVSLGETHILTATGITAPVLITNLGPYYGVGFKFKLNKNFSLYVEDSGIAVIGGQYYGAINQGTVGLEITM